MKTIHEQDWTRFGAVVEMLSKDGDAVGSIAVEANEPKDAGHILRFISQAPKLAARLREIHRIPSNERCEVVLDGEFIDAIGDLLREAGVPL